MQDTLIPTTLLQQAELCQLLAGARMQATKLIPTAAARVLCFHSQVFGNCPSLGVWVVMVVLPGVGWLCYVGNTLQKGPYY